VFCAGLKIPARPDASVVFGGELDQADDVVVEFARGRRTSITFLRGGTDKTLLSGPALRAPLSPRVSALNLG
jgi:hypothetical protein